MSATGQPQHLPTRAPFSIPRAFACTDPERLREVVGLGRRAEAEDEPAAMAPRLGRGMLAARGLRTPQGGPQR